MSETSRHRKRARSRSNSRSSGDRRYSRSRSKSKGRSKSSRHSERRSDRHKKKKKKKRHKEKKSRRDRNSSSSRSRSRSKDRRSRSKDRLREHRRSRSAQKSRSKSRESRNRNDSRSKNKSDVKDDQPVGRNGSRNASPRVRSPRRKEPPRPKSPRRKESPRPKSPRRKESPRPKSPRRKDSLRSESPRRKESFKEKDAKSSQSRKSPEKRRHKLDKPKIREKGEFVVEEKSVTESNKLNKLPKGTIKVNLKSLDEREKKLKRLRLWKERKAKELAEENAEEEKKLVLPMLSESVNEDKNNIEKTDETGIADLQENDEKDAESKGEDNNNTEQKDQEDEVDPLDAFMMGLEGQAEAQESFSRTSPVPSLPKPPTTISLTEIEKISTSGEGNAYASFMQPESMDTDDIETTYMDTNESFPYGGVTPGRVEETDEAREEREKREHAEFMEAIRRKSEAEEKGLQDVDDNDVPLKKKEKLGRIYQGLEEDIISEEAGKVEKKSALEILQDAQKKKEIKEVDHSKINYMSFRKKFYIPIKEISEMSDEEASQLRAKLEIKVRGKGCPMPIEKWKQCGFSQRMLRLIEKHKYDQPFAIQRQALPAVMSGRDVIGIAKTGSGKTLAFVLPMFRHILDQPPLRDGEGPIGLIMAPARELAQQILNETKKFARDLGMRTTAVYGGSSVSEQIANLKRGSDIVVCTPGRMIDILSMNAGRLVSLERVTYVVLDEADRMFDMGFEPQISKIMMNVRPDRQTLLFSATFPRSVESLARKVLKKPIEITVGARSTASGDIKQYVEVREENDKFMRLLQLLGVWYEKGNVLVFVNTQQACDQIFQDLMKAGYPSLSLHGGKDQMDRDYTIDDFKRKVRTLMVATSVAGRGLDVKDLVLVINYHCPNHLEEYVHRVGRTGRAGNKGTAYTFISPDEEEYAPDLVKALENAKQDIPQALKDLNNNFMAKVKRGEARFHGSGFKGKGFTFDEDEKSESQRLADLQKRQYEIEEGHIDVEVEEDTDTTNDVEAMSAADKARAVAAAITGSKFSTSKNTLSAAEAIQKAQRIAMMLDNQYMNKITTQAGEGHFQDEIEINDYPQQARWKVTQKESIDSVAELTGAAVIARGSYVPAGRRPNPGERKLYLAIEGPTIVSIQEARREIQLILDETTMQVGLGGDKYSKYSI